MFAAIAHKAPRPTPLHDWFKPSIATKNPYIQLGFYPFAEEACQIRVIPNRRLGRLTVRSRCPMPKGAARC